MMLAVAACGDGETAEEGAAGAEGDNEGAAEGDDEPISVSITLADGYPAEHPNEVGGSTYFIDRVTELGAERNIEVEFEYLGASSLGDQSELFDLAADGVTDIAGAGMSLFAEAIPEVGVVELPALYDDTVVAAQIATRMYTEDLQDRFIDETGLRTLFVAALEPYQIFTIDAPVEAPDDIRGLSFRSPGGVCSFAMSALGGNPVQMPVTDQYAALQRGTIDGHTGPPGLQRPYQVEEVTNHVTDNLAVCGLANLWAVNESWFQSQDPRVQELLEEVGLEAAQNVGEVHATASTEALEYFADSGMNVYSVQDTSSWESALEDVTQQWIDEVSALGVDGEALIDRWNELAQEF